MGSVPSNVIQKDRDLKTEPPPLPGGGVLFKSAVQDPIPVHHAEPVTIHCISMGQVEGEPVDGADGGKGDLTLVPDLHGP